MIAQEMEVASHAVQGRWSDLFRRTVETMAIDGYRSGALTERQVGCMLRLQTRSGVQRFLKDAGIALDEIAITPARTSTL